MKSAVIKYLLLILVLSAVFSCGEKEPLPTNKYFVTTNEPLAMLLRDIAGDSNSIYCIIPPGVSHHTFSPKPADINITEKSLALFYISDNVDNWVSRFDNAKTIQIIQEIPAPMLLYVPETEKAAENIEPHFWTDPLIMKVLVPRLANIMSELNPTKTEIYKANAVRLVKKLTLLDNEIRQALKPYKGKSVLLFHPSFLYFLRRYGLKYAGAVETSPGKQPTLQDIATLKRKIQNLRLKAVYTEPQLPKRSLNVLVHGTGIEVLELDPLGGLYGRDNYFDLMRFNLKNILKGFSD